MSARKLTAVHPKRIPEIVGRGYVPSGMRIRQEKEMNDIQKTQASYALLVDPHTGHEFNLCRFATSIGRSIASDIVLLDRSVSRQHAVVYCIRGKFFVEDIGSTNGTKVNGSAVQKKVIRSGDTIKIGKRNFTLQYQEIGSPTSLEDF